MNKNSVLLALHRLGNFTGLSISPSLSESPKAIGPVMIGEMMVQAGHYTQIWNDAKVIGSRDASVASVARAILHGKPEYQIVEAKTGAPWFWVGSIHSLESSCRFNTYLHNGDPLGKPTTHVPKGIFFPSGDWHGAAVDALSRQGLSGLKSWGIEDMLRRAEGYNGWGYKKHGINSPYVWSYTSAYTKGKYVRDGVWDSTAVSQQVGVAAILKKLVQMQEIVII